MIRSMAECIITANKHWNLQKLYKGLEKSGYDTDLIKSPTRKRGIVEIRFMCIKYLRDKGFCLTEIGQIFSRDHSTILHGLMKHDDYCFYDDNYKKSYQILLENIGE